MGLSNYVPSSRISQAGVIPNSAARPASPYEGMMVYQTDDNALYIFDGSNWVKTISASQPPALQLIKTQTFSTINNFDVTSVFSSEFKNYRIILNVDTQSTNGLVFFRYLTSGGVFSTNYWWQGLEYAGSTTTGLSQGADNAKQRICFNYTSYLFATFEIANPFEAKHTQSISVANAWNPSGTNLTNQVSGIINTNDVFTGIRFGLFDNPSYTFSGTCSVFGYR